MIICNNVERAERHQSEHMIEQCADNATAAERIVDTVTLDETDRHRRRFLLTSDSGIEFLLELPSAILLMHDDVLRLNDGRGIRVQAMPEALYEIRGANPTHLLTLTWHVGNRHLATQILDNHVRIRRDPVIRTMLEQLGAQVVSIQAGFNPEGGAYGDTHSAHHDHDHDHGHDHGNGHDHDHGHDHGHEQASDHTGQHQEKRPSHSSQ